MRYIVRAYASDQVDPAEETILAEKEALALDQMRGLLQDRKSVRQAELWKDDRRIATIERVI